MEQMELKKKLALKVAKMAQEIGKMEEDGSCTNSNGKLLYNYISSNSLNTKMRGLLLKHGLWIFTSYVDYEERDTESSTSYGIKITTRTVVKAMHEIIDLDTGYSITLSSIGADQDSGGKSCGQAETESSKRWMFKNFFVTSSDEVDPDSKTTEIGKPKPKKSAKSTFTDMARRAGYSDSEIKDLANSTFNGKPTEENIKKWLDDGYEVVSKDEFHE